jgi:hypothetical protein
LYFSVVWEGKCQITQTEIWDSAPFAKGAEPLQFCRAPHGEECPDLKMPPEHDGGWNGRNPAGKDI